MCVVDCMLGAITSMASSHMRQNLYNEPGSEVCSWDGCAQVRRMAIR